MFFTKTMLVKLQRHLVFDSNLTLTFLHNVTLKYRFIRDELNNSLKELEKHNIIKHIGSSSEDKANFGTVYSNPMIIIPKGDSIECVLDSRLLYSKTEQSDESWPIESLVPQLKSTIVLSTSCMLMPLLLLMTKLLNLQAFPQVTSFLLSRGFYGPKGFTKFLHEAHVFLL